MHILHELFGASNAEMVAGITTLITTTILSVIVAGWIFYDAKKRKFDSLSASIWAIAAFFIWFLFLPTWFLTRPNMDPTTGEVIPTPNTGANKAIKGCAFGCLGILLLSLVIGLGIIVFASFALR